MPPKRRNTRTSRREPSPVTETTEQIIERRVAEAIAQYEASRARSDAANGSGTTARNQTGERTPVTNEPSNTQQGCSYKTFLACKPSTFTGTEGAIGLIHWFEKMESVFDISDCATNNMVKFATCTLADKALTWWNSQVQILRRTTAYAISWETLKEMMTEEFCSPNEIQKLETELWNIQMTGADISGYTTRFQELARLVPHMVTPEKERIKRYIKGLAPQIRGMVMSSKPTTFRSAVDLAQSLTDDALLIGTLKTTTEKSGLLQIEAADSANNKRKWNNESNDRQGQQNKNSGNTRAYVATTATGSKPYLGNKPKCDKCGRHHDGDCSLCGNCNQWGHRTNACKNNPPAQPNPGQQNTGCFRCGEPGHYRNQCPQLNNANNNQNNNRGNNNNNRNANIPAATGRAYILRAPDAQPDPYANIGTF